MMKVFTSYASVIMVKVFYFVLYTFGAPTLVSETEPGPAFEVKVLILSVVVCHCCKPLG